MSRRSEQLQVSFFTQRTSPLLSGYHPPKMENQMEQKMEYEMEAKVIYGFYTKS